MKAALLNLFLLFITATAYCGSGEFVLNGKVLDENNQELPGATVLLKHKIDSGLFVGVQSNPDGSFSFEKVPAGDYFLEITYVGFSPEYRSDIKFSLQKNSVDLGAIRLKQAQNKLNEFEITAEKAYIENTAGKTTVNIDQNTLFKGNNGVEVLEKMPGVNISREGSVSLNGQNGVSILVDGKALYLSGQNLQNYLKSYQSDNIEKIEISSGGSAKNDASGKAGIINIITKKNRLPGLNGNVSAGAGLGRFAKYNTSLMIGYKMKKLNTLFSLNLDKRKGFTDLILTRELKNGESTESIIRSRTYALFPFRACTPRLNADYQLTTQTSLALAVSGTLNDFTPQVKSNLTVNNSQDALLMQQTMTTIGKDNFGNFSAGTELKHIFDTTGKELSFNMDFFSAFHASKQNIKWDFQNQNGLPAQPVEYKADQLGRFKLWAIKSDYVYPFAEHFNFETGIKSSQIEAKALNNFYSISGNDERFDASRSNDFILKENINAFYLSLSGTRNAIKIVSGLRIENSRLRGGEKKTAEKISRTGTQLFPNFSLEKELDKNNRFAVNLSRRIERPPYQNLNPHRHNIDASSVDHGNPTLRAQLISKAELTWSNRNMIFINAGYSRTRDEISQVIFKTYENNTAQTYDNVGIFHYYFSGLTFSKTIFGLLKCNYNGIVFYGKLSPYSQYNVSHDLFSYSISASNSLSLKHNFSLDFQAKYNFRYVEGFSLMEPNTIVSAGIQKSFNDNKGSINLSMSDVFYTMVISGLTLTDGIVENWSHYRDTRVLNLSFSYRFGKEKSARMRKISGADAEKSRIG